MIAILQTTKWILVIKDNGILVQSSLEFILKGPMEHRSALTRVIVRPHKRRVIIRLDVDLDYRRHIRWNDTTLKRASYSN